ncbi:MAG: hypothetical protein ACJATS_002389, partial [Psychroserpens sp.]
LRAALNPISPKRWIFYYPKAALRIPCAPR